MAADSARWHVLVPIKGLDEAKRRLAVDERLRRDLALAMTLDTLDAIGATDVVSTVWVVTSDPDVMAQIADLVDHTVQELPPAAPPHDRLNRAVTQGLAAVGHAFPDEQVAVVMSDLPAMRPADLSASLTSAAGLSQGVVADASGRGSTALVASRHSHLRPHFGADSYADHLLGGAVDLPAAAGVRCDVDTLADLAAATRLGMGPRTTAVASRGLL